MLGNKIFQEIYKTIYTQNRVSRYNEPTFLFGIEVEIDRINPYTIKLYEDITNKISIPYADLTEDEGNLVEQSQEVKEAIVSLYKEGDVLIMTPEMRSHLLETIESKFKCKWLSEGVLLLEHRISGGGR